MVLSRIAALAHPVPRVASLSVPRGKQVYVIGHHWHRPRGRRNENCTNRKNRSLFPVCLPATE